MKNMRAWIPALVGLMTLSGCAYVSPWVGNFNLVSVDQEKEIGVKMRDEVARQTPLVQDPVLVEAVRQPARRLVQSLPRVDFDYQFYVVKDETPNAFTIPGGAIYVHTGLLKFATPAEVAGVLAHEIGHAYERHPAKSLSRAYGLDFLGKLVFRENQKDLSVVTEKILQGGILSKYSRDDEYEADTVGYYLLRRSGYTGNELLSFLKKLESLSGPGSVPPFLSTHPPTPDRIARLESLENTRVEFLTRQGSEVSKV